MEGISIAVHSVNAQLVGLSELTVGKTPTVLTVPGGGRILLATKETLALVADLLGPGTKASNPYEQRRQKEYLRRAGRVVRAYNEPAMPSI